VEALLKAGSLGAIAWTFGSYPSHHSLGLLSVPFLTDSKIGAGFCHATGAAFQGVISFRWGTSQMIGPCLHCMSYPASILFSWGIHPCGPSVPVLGNSGIMGGRFLHCKHPVSKSMARMTGLKEVGLGKWCLVDEVHFL